MAMSNGHADADPRENGVERERHGIWERAQTTSVIGHAATLSALGVLCENPRLPPSRPHSRSVGNTVRRVLSQNDERDDRKSTRLNSSHRCITYAVFCLKTKITYD